MLFFKIRIHNFFFPVQFQNLLCQQIWRISSFKPASPPPDLWPFVNEHVPVLAAERRNCVVCYMRERKQFKVQTYCKAPQSKKCMYVATDKKCFELFHSPDYPYER